MPDSDNLGHKILSFFIKEESLSGKPAPASPAPAGSSAAPTSAAPAPTGTVDAKFAEHFAGVLAKNNLPGPDYFEFRETLRSLASLGLSEDQQYQAAWASFKALGGAPDVARLTSTANQYLAILGKDREAFGQSVEAAIAERVGGLQREQQQLQADSEALTRQLAEIQQKLAANATRLAAIGGEVAEQSGRLNQNRHNYEATYGHFTSQIRADLAKIAQYLK
ncbi:hypothetical protein FNT36_12795 [Hymenobacter setariae]|uniref:Uncharacterized protein n=1 Tax=Hymenobacter setariae TaxID=2594794 RepID=A0A558BV52_9BACT|nr:hypothetical protein [Hymenobacter setariae]TVT40352.1 hypothetical protein FNT36_12795 [Hymenobacter setariae]